MLRCWWIKLNPEDSKGGYLSTVSALVLILSLQFRSGVHLLACAPGFDSLGVKWWYGLALDV